jgi:hypothetical protein
MQHSILLRSAARAAYVSFRFLGRHQWLTSALIVFGAVATLVLWTLLLPLPEAHGAYNIPRSLRFNAGDSAYLARTPASTSNTTTWTFSAWVKRGSLGGDQLLFSAGTGVNNQTFLYFISTNELVFGSVDSGITRAGFQTQGVYRDPAAWMHIVVAYDEGNLTNTERVRMYANGVRITAFSSATYPPGGAGTFMNSAVAHAFGRSAWTAAGYLDGYMSDVYLIDGQALGPESFAETDVTTGSWKAKAYSDTYGGNGYHLDFADSSALGDDVSGNNNDWTSNNLDATDQVRDTPTNNFSTYSVIDKVGSPVFSQGNTRIVSSGSAGDGVRSGFGISSGKWYWETPYINSTASDGCAISGIESTAAVIDTSSSIATVDASTYVLRDDGFTINNGGFSSGFTNFGPEAVVTHALDLDSGKYWFGINGVWEASGNPVAGTGAQFSSLTGTFAPYIGFQCSGTMTWIVNAGPLAYATSTATANTYYASAGGSFRYQPPTGFKALSTANLPEPAIKKPSNFFNAKTYTGNGATQLITGLNFQPDLVWIKARSVAYHHRLYDAQRGITKALYSDTTDAEGASQGDNENFVSFDAGGFSLGSAGQPASDGLNQNGETFVSWNWAQHATPGFDIVSYTGNGLNRTITHNLGVAPKFIIIKARTAAYNWAVYHGANTSAPETDYLLLNSTAATADDNTLWNDTAPTSSVFSVGTSAAVNENGTTYVAYVWAEVPGFSSFGSYIGNGSTNGPFVYTGFKPRWLLIKDTVDAYHWRILDAARATHNPATGGLYPDTSDAEDLFDAIDFLANGFKLRSTDGVNAAQLHVYAAFAEAPFKYATAGATFGNLAPFIAWEF